MNRPLALLFAVVGVLLLTGIGASISFRSPAAVLFFTIASLGSIGSGFMLKAKLSRKNGKPDGPR